MLFCVICIMYIIIVTNYMYSYMFNGSDVFIYINAKMVLSLQSLSLIFIFRYIFLFLTPSDYIEGGGGLLALSTPLEPCVGGSFLQKNKGLNDYSAVTCKFIYSNLYFFAGFFKTFFISCVFSHVQKS